MSKQLKILLGALGAIIAAAVVLTMFGLPPNLPLGPLQGVLAGEDETIDAADDGTFTDPALTGIDPNCDPSAGGLGTTDPAATDPTTGAPLDPSAGGTIDPSAGATDPATGAPLDPSAGTTGDPAATGAGAPVAAGEGWVGDARVVAAGAGGYDSSRVTDSWISAAEATDPTTGAPIDPAAGTGTDPAAGTGAVDPVTGAPLDPAAGGTTDPAAPGAADPAAGGVADPCAGIGTADPSLGGADATGTDPAAAGAGAGAGTGAGAGAGANAVNRVTTDGTNEGNNPEALRAAKDATGVMQKANITVSTTATLVPAAGGIGRPPAVRRYRQNVTSATLVMQLDEAAMQQWTGAGKKVQTDLVRSFLARLGKSYRGATRSISIVDSQGTVLAVGDARPGRGQPTVKLY